MDDTLQLNEEEEEQEEEESRKPSYEPFINFFSQDLK